VLQRFQKGFERGLILPGRASHCAKSRHWRVHG
jgi:hypothetical protein